VIGAVAAIGIAGLAFALVSFLTTYPLLNVTNWKAVGVYRYSEKIGFSVANSGTGRATGCRGHLRLGDGRQFSRAEPSVPHGRSRKFVVTYPKSAASSRYEATVWAQCGGASTVPTPISAPANVALIASRAAVRAGHSVTTVRFSVQNRGAQGAAGCTAYLRLSTGKALSRRGQPTVPADAQVQSAFGGDQRATFAIAFRTATRGAPELAWASCRSPDSPGGRAVSTKTAVPNG
jgi:hypothetical protein